MISYREKELILVQKMLKDDIDQMITQSLDIIDNPQSAALYLKTSYSESVDVEDYDALVDLAKERGYHTYLRVEDILSAEELLELEQRRKEIDNAFSKKTGIINKLDLTFIALAVALQCVRQYVLTPFEERTDDKAAAEKVKGKKEEHSNRKHRYYQPSLEEIITNPVPFDANIGSNGALKGGGSLGHRSTAIGHDPLIGLVIGTANIATSTLTTWNMKTYHINTANKRDVFSANASTRKMLDYTKKKIFDEGMDGKMIMAVSLMKEIEHLHSDVYSKKSLPLPVISAISPEMSSILAEYGFDMANVIAVTKQATLAALFNWLIATLHGMFFMEKPEDSKDFEMNKKLYEVRTRKILLISNLIASSSNILYVALTKDKDKLDVGGILVTITRLFSDIRFISRIKQEFVEREIDKQFQEELVKLGI